jgi:hypothetical protein
MLQTLSAATRMNRVVAANGFDCVLDEPIATRCITVFELSFPSGGVDAQDVLLGWWESPWGARPHHESGCPPQSSNRSRFNNRVGASRSPRAPFQRTNGKDLRCRSTKTVWPLKPSAAVILYAVCYFGDADYAACL